MLGKEKTSQIKKGTRRKIEADTPAKMKKARVRYPGTRDTQQDGPHRHALTTVTLCLSVSYCCDETACKRRKGCGDGSVDKELAGQG